MKNINAIYRTLLDSGEFEQRVSDAFKHLSICDVCALNCPVDRLLGELGACKTGINAKISSYTPHHGEENPLRGWRGSGTIFFSRCNLKCQYCQNYDISQTDSGEEISPDELARIMLLLQSYGCHNINFVSPSHVVPQIISAVMIAAKSGLHIPLVYNSGGYDSLTMLKLLDGVIDIYMPDMKYGNSTIAQKYSKIPNYATVNQLVVKEMHRQVGDLIIDSDELAVQGLLVRHLVLPQSLAGTNEVVQFLAKEISKETYINIMDQYRPAYHANQYPEINRPLYREEYQAAVKLALDAGLQRLDKDF
jgi:putative pyruvate formate lyase activating enzyme